MGMEKRKVWKLVGAVVRCLTGALFLMGFIFPLTLQFATIFSISCAGIGLAIIFFPVWFSRLKKLRKGKTKPLYWAGVVCSVLFLFLFLTESLFMVMATVEKNPREEDPAVVVVLGASVLGYTPSLDLQSRIKAAGSLLQSNPDAVCIATGGLGDRAKMTESACIKRDLMQIYGIESHRIFTEETSTNTMENLQNAKSILEEKGLGDQITIVTGEYHMFRAKFLAKRVGLVPRAHASKTDIRIFLPSYIRELLAIPKSVVVDTVES